MKDPKATKDIDVFLDEIQASGRRVQRACNALLIVLCVGVCAVSVWVAFDANRSLTAMEMNDE